MQAPEEVCAGSGEWTTSGIPWTPEPRTTLSSISRASFHPTGTEATTSIDIPATVPIGVHPGARPLNGSKPSVCLNSRRDRRHLAEPSGRLRSRATRRYLTGAADRPGGDFRYRLSACSVIPTGARPKRSWSISLDCLSKESDRCTIGPIPFFGIRLLRMPQNRFRWKSEKSAGKLKNPLENKFSSRKSRFPAEREIFRWKFENSAGKLKNLLENKFSSGKSKSSAGKMKHLLEI